MTDRALAVLRRGNRARRSSETLARRGSRSSVRLRIAGLVAAVAVAAPLFGCAQEPIAGWQPPAAQLVPGITLLGESGDLVDGDDGQGGDAGADEPGADGAEHSVDDTEEGADGAELSPAPGLEITPIGSDVPGFVGGRLRNDALPFAARFVYISGVPDFNQRVNALLSSTIQATGERYVPQVFPGGAGLGDRGCVPGSTSWLAADVLSRPETGPSNGRGTAVTCEITAAFSTKVVVALRVVTGTPDEVATDKLQTLIVDVKSGNVAEVTERWSENAPAELWARTAELLRQSAGGLSTAPISPPNEEQLAMTKRALDAAAPIDAAGSGNASSVVSDAGGVDVTLPEGVQSPELAGLGIGDEPVTVRVDAETVNQWSSEQHRALLNDTGIPFVGVNYAHVSVDCGLIPCVALTYDDGPSGATGELLDTLKQKHARATFFMIGGSAAGNTGTVQRVHNEGHEIGSHTMSHPDLTKLSLANAKAQVLDAAGIIERATGVPVRMYRPPYGAINQAVLNEIDMPAILWSIDTNDWQNPGAAALRERGVDWPTAGDIVLFHDTHVGSVNVAGEVIDGLRDRGFEPVTVTELFGGSVPSGRVSGR